MIDILNDSVQDSQPGWWAVYTKHQHEKRVAEMLVAKGAEVFLPLYDSDRRRRDRTVRLSFPLFPSYLFVREWAKMRQPILTTPGVHMIVTRGSAFGVVPDSEIQNLRIALSTERAVEPYEFLRIGERVRIIGGALAGLEGFLIREKSQCRVVISVQMLAQAAAVEVNLNEIAPVRLRQSASASIRVPYPDVIGCDSSSIYP
jgi:transcription antitermination factor NusG